jgi:hypothetical protein
MPIPAQWPSLERCRDQLSVKLAINMILPSVIQFESEHLLTSTCDISRALTSAILHVLHQMQHLQVGVQRVPHQDRATRDELSQHRVHIRQSGGDLPERLLGDTRGSVYVIVHQTAQVAPVNNIHRPQHRTHNNELEQ